MFIIEWNLTFAVENKNKREVTDKVKKVDTSPSKKIKSNRDLSCR